jgi:PQQ-dependent catabolism-associated CXXCW motif protein
LRPWRLAILLLLTGALGGGAGAQEFAPEPEGYREEPYRGLVPATLAGATVIDTDQAYAMWQAGEAAFIDVLPRAPKPANLPEGTIWRDKPRSSIPGAIWLPNVGYGRIADVTAAYFRDGLYAATGGDTSRDVVFFCLEECWMSWNAAKRAAEWGFSAVHWFPEGTDGWSSWNYPLERIEPFPGQPQAQASE